MKGQFSKIDSFKEGSFLRYRLKFCPNLKILSFFLEESVILMIDDKWYCFNRVTFKVLETTYRKLYLYRNNGTGCNFYLNR